MAWGAASSSARAETLQLPPGEAGHDTQTKRVGQPLENLGKLLGSPGFPYARVRHATSPPLLPLHPCFIPQGRPPKIDLAATPPPSRGRLARLPSRELAR